MTFFKKVNNNTNTNTNTLLLVILFLIIILLIVVLLNNYNISNINICNEEPFLVRDLNIKYSNGGERNKNLLPRQCIIKIYCKADTFPSLNTELFKFTRIFGKVPIVAMNRQIKTKKIDYFRGYQIFFDKSESYETTDDKVPRVHFITSNINIRTIGLFDDDDDPVTIIKKIISYLGIKTNGLFYG
jgi:hypothetical protein